MTRIANRAQLERLRRKLARARDPQRPCITVCGGTGCRAHGSQHLSAAFRDELQHQGLASAVDVLATGCHGFCEQGPVVVIRPQNVFYRGVKPDDAAEVVSQTVTQGHIVERLLYTDPITGQRIVREPEVPFYQRQRRIVLDQNGVIDPTRIDDYVAQGGYAGLSKALCDMTPGAVIDALIQSRLRGRGGAGFSTGTKWRLCREAPGDVKYVICNADEGDPGAYMDRSVMEGNPHRVLEGMLIGAFAIGAQRGFVYIRNEYPLAVENLRIAIAQAEEYGLLGEDILGAGFDFAIEVRLGSGAFVCGEETALMASIEGRVGEPRPRPPFPAQSGLWGRPTNINNVETWANVPLIVTRGAEWYAGLGSKDSGGTKIFSLVGKINNTGLVEVPIGTPLGDIIYDIGGGIPKGKQFKAAQIGGPAGGCVTRQHLNTPIDYGTLQQLGAIMGSGGLVVCDEDTCMVDLARYFLKFTQEESCGKCVPCRVGTRAMLDTLERICRGQGHESDLDYLTELAGEIRRSALCGLGQNAPNPVLTTMRYFSDEYAAHIHDKRCPAGVCQDLFRSPCQNACPVGTDVPGYVSLVGEGRLEEALAVLLNTNPFPSVCGRVCDHQCERKCRRNQIDDAVAIRALKRFAADHATGQLRPGAGPTNGQPPVAIVGAGPAGLSCAYFLARLGYRTTVFERLPVAGGMLAVGIPDYRLPRRVLKKEIEAIESLGVEIRTGTAIGRDGFAGLAQLREQGYGALFIAVGAHRSRTLGVPGEELRGVIHATDLLREVSLDGKRVKVSGRVAVVGGGNAAIDAARTALRLGADKVAVLYRRTREEMPAQQEEVRAAEEEGVEFHFLTAPQRIVGNGNGVEAVECQRMRLGQFDASGRRQPLPSDETWRFEADIVVPAIGQASDTADLCAGLGIETEHAGLIRVDKHGRTDVPYIFAGGDVTSGPATVIQAIAAGQHGAEAIDQHLSPAPERVYPWRQTQPVATFFDPQADPVPYGRCAAPELSPAQRLRNFHEVERPLDRNTATREAHRCLRCDYRETEA